MTRHFSLLTLILFICLIGFSHGQSQRTINIGMVYDGDWQLNDSVSVLFRDEIIELTRGEFDVRFPEDKRFSGNWQLEGVRQALDRILKDRTVDMVLTMGLIASNEVARRYDLPKPVIAPFVLDVNLQDLPRKNGASGVRNLSYIALPATIDRDIATFLEITPFRRLTVLLNGVLVEALPEIRNRIVKVLKTRNVEPVIVAVENPADALNALDENTEAVYYAPLMNLSESENNRIFQRMIDLKIPSFSLLGRQQVERGILGSLNPDIFPRLSRRVALNCQRILLGEPAAGIPFAFAPGEELSINMATARAIGVYPPWSIMTEAVLINDERSRVERQLTLAGAMVEGLKANRDLIAKNQEIRAGRQSVKAARANLLPQVDLTATGLQIDADRAGFAQAERTLTAGASVSQVLFSDDALTNYAVQKDGQRSLEKDGDITRLDIAQAIATAYLQLLNARAFEDLQKQNLRTSTSNLELARIRESIGSSGRADVYRWESEIAFNRKSVIEANARRNVAEIQFNRLLNRPLEEKFVLNEITLANNELFPEDKITRYMSNPWTFKVMRHFLVEEGVRNSPEIEQLDAAIDIQERILKNTGRALVLPTLVAQAEFSRRLLEAGEGSEDLVLDPNDPLAGIFESFDTGDDNNWSVALNASFPLFSGGARLANRGKALESLEELRTRRQSVYEKIEQRIRNAAHTTGASYAGIRQTLLAAEAASKNLELVTDAYSSGAIVITRLIDAQSAALVADLAAAVAVYDFLIDMVEMQRSVGTIILLESVAEKNGFFQRADAFFEKSGVKLK